MLDSPDWTRTSNPPINSRTRYPDRTVRWRKTDLSVGIVVWCGSKRREFVDKFMDGPSTVDNAPAHSCRAIFSPGYRLERPVLPQISGVCIVL